MIRVALLSNYGNLNWFPDDDMGNTHLIWLGFDHSVDTAAWGFFGQRIEPLFYIDTVSVFKEDSSVYSSNGQSRSSAKKTTLMRSGLLYLSNLPHRLFQVKHLPGNCCRGGRFSCSSKGLWPQGCAKQLLDGPWGPVVVAAFLFLKPPSSERHSRFPALPLSFCGNLATLSDQRAGLRYFSYI